MKKCPYETYIVPLPFESNSLSSYSFPFNSIQINFQAFSRTRSSLYSFIVVSYRQGNLLMASIRFSFVKFIAAILSIYRDSCYCSGASQCVKVEYFQLCRIVTHGLKKRDAHAVRQNTRTLFGQRHKKRIKCELGFRAIQFYY